MAGPLGSNFWQHVSFELFATVNAKLELLHWHGDTDYDVSFPGIVCFVALRPKSTAMVIAGRSVHLTTLFPGQACTSA